MIRRLLGFIGAGEQKKSDCVFTVLVLLFTLLLACVPSLGGTGFSENDKTARVHVTSVNNDDVRTSGIVQQGTQQVFGTITSGRYKGASVEGRNILMGSLQEDKLFSPGDTAFIAFDTDSDGTVRSAYFYDYYRIEVILFLFGLFVLLLFVFAGITGIKAVISFIFTGMVIWKIMLPGFLYGIPPVPLALVIVSLLTFVIIFLIGGFNKKGTAAFLGSFAGLLFTCVLSLVFGALFRVHGAVRPFAETLLRSGYPDLDLTGIFLAGIFISASGAVMDIAMDISAAMHEVTSRHPEISYTDAVLSGLSVGRAVIGTMTTTLLLAYSGGFTAMLMVFIVRGVPGANILNFHHVAAE
ncbi:MAG: YibE/F family protein, partial [Spirochaetota bacterium]